MELELEQINKTIEFKEMKLKLLEMCKDTYNMMVGNFRNMYGQEDRDLATIENCFYAVINGIELENADLINDFEEMRKLKEKIKEQVEI